MASSAKRRDKGKALAQGSSQDKKLLAGRSFVKHEGASYGVKPSRSTSLQEFVPTEVTYSSGDMLIALQEILSRNLQFHNGTNLELPYSIKFILITFKLLIPETTANFSRKPFEHLKSTLLTLLLKMRLIQATMLTLLQNMPILFQKMRLIEAILLTNQILQINPMISILVNSLAKSKSILWIK